MRDAFVFFTLNDLGLQQQYGKNRQPTITEQSSITSKKKLDIIAQKPVFIKDQDQPRSQPLPVSKGDEEREIGGGLRLRFEDAESELKSFDICSKYGPCMSLTRRERYNRAKSLDLAPPERISNILDAFPELSKNSIWHGRA
uniref:DNA polymerase delta subunit 4 n=1 Tax=Cryptomonas paramaecium TaxID=2898 RepID=A0A7S4PS88_9CRYP